MASANDLDGDDKYPESAPISDSSPEAFESKRFAPIELGFLIVVAFLIFLASSLLTEASCYML